MYLRKRKVKTMKIATAEASVLDTLCEETFLSAFYTYDLETEMPLLASN